MENNDKGEVSDNHVSPSYSSIRYGIIRVTPNSLRCKLYCRGANCKYCSWKRWSPKDQAIQGLYSSWITDKILAMSRPTVKTFENDNLIGQFRKANICAVINLQMLGEHESCGPRLLSSGFTYDPETLMENGIQYYNFLWPDFGALGIDTLLDIVKVVHSILRQGKVAIHCHAGLGRTGVVIAAYMVWANHCTFGEAISRVRIARPNSVQSKKQIKLMKDFWMFVEKNGAALPKPGTLRFNDYVRIQSKILCNNQARKYRHIPKVLHAVMEELLLAVHGELDGMTRIWAVKILKCASYHDWESLVRCPARLPIPSKMKTQEIDICICGVLENRCEMFDLTTMKFQGKFELNNCRKYIRSHLRGNMLFLLRTLDQLMNSFIKPIIPRQQLLEITTRNNEHELSWELSQVIKQDWHCLHRYLLTTMASLGIDNYSNMAKLISRWYIGTISDNDDDKNIITALESCLQRA